LHKKRQKDTDARWTQKNNINYFGYKNHVKQDAKSKLIVKYLATSANVHDSQATEQLLDEKDKGQAFYADSAYSGKSQQEIICNKEMSNKVCEKSAINRSLTSAQKACNREKSRVRSRVEHIGEFYERHDDRVHWNQTCNSYNRTYELDL
jgi:IS5 family transposase